MKLILESLGEEIVARKLINMAGRAIDVEPAMDAIVGQIRAAEKRQFDTAGAYGSGGWAALAPSTIARKGNDRILRDTDALYEALTGETGDSIAITNGEGLDFGTTLFYAGIHQTGSEDGEHPPRRRVAQLPDDVRREMVRTLHQFIIAEDQAMIAAAYGRST